MAEDSGWPPLTKQERRLLRVAIACDTNCVEAYPVQSARWCDH